MEWAVSRILYPAKRVMTIYLGCRSPGTSSDLPGSIGRAALKCLSIWSCFGWGLPCLSCVFCGTFRRSPGVRVTNHPALWSSDFPLDATTSDHAPTPFI